MKAKVTIKLNNSAIADLEKIQEQAVKMTAEAVLSDIHTSAVVPADRGMSGGLESTGFVDESKLHDMVVSIVFDTPYARRLYWHPEYNFRQDKNPNAQGKWMQSYIDGDKQDFIKETYMKFFKQLSKGLVK